MIVLKSLKNVVFLYKLPIFFVDNCFLCNFIKNLSKKDV